MLVGLNTNGEGVEKNGYQEGHSERERFYQPTDKDMREPMLQASLIFINYVMKVDSLVMTT